MADYILSKTGAAIDSALAKAEKAIRFDSQSLTNAEKAQARTNMSVPSVADVTTISSALSSAVSSLSTGLSTVNSALNSAVSSINANIGSLSNLNTTTKSDVVSAINEVVGVVDTKADEDGYYEELTAGRAENIISNLKSVDTIPYSFRTTGGGLDVGDTVQEESITGLTVLWRNQTPSYNSSHVSYNSSTDTYNINYTGDNTSGVVTVSIGSAYNSSHVYYTFLDGNLTNYNQSLRWRFPGGPTDSDSVHTNTTVTTETQVQEFFNQHGILCKGGSQSSFSVSKSSSSKRPSFALRVAVFDLTSILGPEVANYLYSLGPKQGIALFRKLFPSFRYPHVDTSVYYYSRPTKKVNTGFNAYNHTTQTARVVGGVPYRIKGTYTTLTFTEDNGSAVTLTPGENGIFTPTNNGIVTVGGGNSTDTCIYIYWDNSRDNEFESYNAHEYEYGLSTDLKGFLYLDASTNSIYGYGDTYESDGTLTKRVQQTTIGALEWTYDSTNEVFYANADGLKLGGRCLHMRYETCKEYRGEFSSMPDKSLWCMDNEYSSTNIVLKHSSYTTVSAMTTAMGTRELFYELATPVVTSIDPYNSAQVIDNWGTEEFVDYYVANNSRGVALPIYHNSSYPVDLKDKLESAPSSPSTDGTYLLQRQNNTNTYTPYSEYDPSTNIFVGVITQDPNNYSFSIDKSYSELVEAYLSGKIVRVFVDNITGDPGSSVYVSGYADVSGYITSAYDGSEYIQFNFYFVEFDIYYICKIYEYDDDTVVSITGYTMESV